MFIGIRLLALVLALAAVPPALAGVTPELPGRASTERDVLMKNLREGSKLHEDRYGRDIRGRLASEDVEEYVTALNQAACQTPLGTAGANDMQKTFSERGQALQEYWTVAPGVVSNRDLWQPFLIHNHLANDTPHDFAVLAAQASFNDLIRRGGPPTADWAARSWALEKAYVDERRRIARKIGTDPSPSATYRKRKSACTEPAVHTSGTEKPRPDSLSHSLEEFYPEPLRERGLEGLVALSVKVNSSGCVMEAAVLGSSGSDEFDEAALRWVETASFLPAEKDGKPVDGTGPVAVAFNLSDDTSWLRALTDRTLSHGSDAQLPPHLSVVLGLEAHEQSTAVRQIATRVEHEVRAFNVPSSDHQQLVIFTVDEQTQAVTDYLLSPSGELRKAVSYTAGGPPLVLPTDVARSGFYRELQYWSRQERERAQH
jgi:protein TonB